MDELISRQAAIDEIDEWIKAFRENGHKESAADACLIQDGIIQLPSAQPTQLTDEDKETIRIHLSAFKENLCNQHRWNEAKEYEELISRLLSTPSVQPRKGKWIDPKREGCQTWDKKAYAQCSECGAKEYIGWGKNFCPNCGSYNGGDSDG